MKVRMDIDLQPFTVPNFVLQTPTIGARQDQIKETPKFALSELSPEILDQLCEKFTRAVFQKAGKERPPQVGAA